MTGLPVNENCNKCGDPIEEEDSWGRDSANFRVHFPRCMPKEFPPDELDAEWRRLADENPKGRIARLDRELQDLLRQSGANLRILRAFARQSLEKEE